jgi:hypothetical protein
MWLSLIGLFALMSVSASAIPEFELHQIYADAKRIDLRTCKVSSVVALREVVGIPPPSMPVLVKTFKDGDVPPALQPMFPTPNVRGVTFNGGRYVALLESAYDKENQDLLKHELVHAYITQASPEPLPFWIQEGAAVHFSIDANSRFYGGPSKTLEGVTEGHVSILPDTYKRRLHDFHYLIEKVGKPRFYAWLRDAVVTGHVDARPLLGLPPARSVPQPQVGVGWMIRWVPVLAAVLVLALVVVAVVTAKREREVIIRIHRR